MSLVAGVERIHAVAAVDEVELRVGGERVEGIELGDCARHGDEGAEGEELEELHLGGWSTDLDIEFEELGWSRTEGEFVGGQGFLERIEMEEKLVPLLMSKC